MTTKLDDGLTSDVVEDIAQAAQAIYDALGVRVSLTDPHIVAETDNGRVIRVYTDSPIGGDKTIIVRKFHALREDMFNYFVGTHRFVTSFSSQERIGPTMLCYDKAHRILVLQDLGGASTIDEQLRRASSSQQGHAVSRWGATLGTFHRVTYGREKDWKTLISLRNHDTVDPVATSLALQLRDDIVQELCDFCSRSGVAMPGKVRKSWLRTFDTLRHGQFISLSLGDLSATNIVVTPHGTRSINLVGSRYRDVSYDVAFCATMLAAYCTSPRDSLVSTQSYQYSKLLTQSWLWEVGQVWPQLNTEKTMRSIILSARFFWVALATWWSLLEADRQADYLSRFPRFAGISLLQSVHSAHTRLPQKTQVISMNVAHMWADLRQGAAEDNFSELQGFCENMVSLMATTHNGGVSFLQ